MQIKETWKLSVTLFSGTVLSLRKDTFNLCVTESKKKIKRRKRQRLNAHLFKKKSDTVSLDRGRELALFILVVKELNLLDNLSVLIKTRNNQYCSTK